MNLLGLTHLLSKRQTPNDSKLLVSLKLRWATQLSIIHLFCQDALLVFSCLLAIQPPVTKVSLTMAKPSRINPCDLPSDLAYLTPKMVHLVHLVL